MKNILENLTNKKDVGIYSVCTANPLVIEASIEFAKEKNSIAVIESTANQVNQDGGYTGMKPEDYKKMVEEICRKVDYPTERVVLGGDHLGPLTWTHLEENEAMKKATQLVYEYAKAGYTKIHLDTSMRVASDSTDERLSDETIARRSAQLALAARKGYEELLKSRPDAIQPVFIIGSEVPIPGGAQEEEEMVITSPEDFQNTYHVFSEVFTEYGVEDVFERVIAIVVQPGVEYGDATIDHYDRDAAQKLCKSLKNNYDRLIFEGHSTDYQTPNNLRNMVEDGIAILKVGPAMTFALREALFSLSMIEDELVSDSSKFKQVLFDVMKEDSTHWEKYYHGTEEEINFKLKYSYSDRARYYLPNAEVQKALTKMLNNLESNNIPMTLLSQYMPYQYRKVKKGILKLIPEELIKDYIKLYLEDYHFATKVERLG